MAESGGGGGLELQCGIRGSAGKYISMAKGPIALRRPTTIAFRAKLDGIGEIILLLKYPGVVPSVRAPGHERLSFAWRTRLWDSGAGRSQDGRTKHPRKCGRRESKTQY